MHLLVFNELNKMRVNRQIKIEELSPEKSVLLEFKGSEKKGRFDFFVKTPEKKIGIEVLTRPTHNRLKEKLRYAKDVDEFIFAVPKDAFELYKKSSSKGHKQARPSAFDKEFKNPKIRVWLLDLRDLKVLVKSSFSKIYNVKQSG